MKQDPIVEDIHQARQQLLAQHHGDFEAYFASLLRAQKEHPELYAALSNTTKANEHNTAE